MSVPPSRGPAPAPDDADRDATALLKLGYRQELRRAMGAYSSFAVSFSIISVLTGITTTFGDALTSGGTIGLTIGWPLTAAGTTLVALAMAELASAFPTAGALYHWSALFGGPGAGWITAVVNLIGQCAIVAAIDLGLARELAPVLGLPDVAALPLFAAVLASHAILNALTVRLVATLNDVSATVHVVGVLILAVLLFRAPAAGPATMLLRPSAAAAAGTASPSLGFVSSLMLGMFTFTGYDASAHLSEETHDAARGAPRGIVLSVLVSAVFGYLLLMGLARAVPDLGDVTADPHPALFVLRRACGPLGGRFAMGLALLAMWFCGLSSVTSASRTLFAFARDGALPFSTAICRVHPGRQTPIVAIATATIAPFVLVMIARFFEERIFTAMVTMATMGLYVSYALPIALAAIARSRGTLARRGPFSLGRASGVVAWLAVLWSVFVLVTGSLPPNGLAAAMLGVALLAFGSFYFIFRRGKFKGPRITLAALEDADATTTRSEEA